MKASRLKLLSLALGGAGLLVAHLLQEREIEEAVDKRISEAEGRLALSEADLDGFEQ